MMFTEKDFSELSFNSATLFGEEWGVLAAGNEEAGYNAMTIGWGLVGALWTGPTAPKRLPRPVCEVFVRPQRHTKAFADREPMFTVSFFPPEQKKALGYMGAHSGRDEDKVANAGLTPHFIDQTVTFEEASLVLCCRKLYQAPLQEDAFLDASIVKQDYPAKDFHDFYIGEIVKVLVK